jgi:hypothetical protein
MGESEFSNLLMRLADATNKELTDRLVALWWDQFGGQPEDVLRLAFSAALTKHTFWPAVAEFHALLRESKRTISPGPGPEEKTAALLRKLQRYIPDLGIVNDGTRGLLRGGPTGRGEDHDGSGFTVEEKYVLRLMGGALLCSQWTEQDVQFNRPRLVTEFARLEEEGRMAQLVSETSGRTVEQLRAEARKRLGPG